MNSNTRNTANDSPTSSFPGGADLSSAGPGSAAAHPAPSDAVADATATGSAATQRPRRRIRNLLLGGAIAVTTVLGGAAYWAADRYLIPDVQVANASQQTAANQSVITQSNNVAEQASITVETKTTADGSTTYHVATLNLADITQLKSAFANDQFGQNIIEDTSAIAAANNAIFAINGDYYGFRDTGIVIRNGVVYRDSGEREGLAIYADGSAKIYDETETTAAELTADGVWQTLSFGPALVSDGEVIEGIDEVEIDTNFGNHSVQGSHPRTAIGIVDSDTIIFVAVDGRSSTSDGATMTELADILRDLGAQTAYNLDGGGSTTMYANGEVVNTPSNRGGSERGTSDILYVAASDATVTVS